MRNLNFIKTKISNLKNNGEKTFQFYKLISQIIITFVGIGIPIIFQFFKPLHILTHEFTQLYTIIAIIFLFFISSWLTKKSMIKLKDFSDLNKLFEVSFTIMTGAIIMGVLTLSMMYLFNNLYWDCYFYKGVPFFLITWFPAAILAIICGILTGRSNWKWYKSIIFLFIVFILSFIQDIIQLVKGAHIVDFLIGEPLAINQRVSMIIPETHLFQRIFLLIFTGSLWYLGLWRIGSREKPVSTESSIILQHIRKKAISSTLLLLVIAIGFGSYIGIGWGNAALNSELSEQHKSKNFIFHFTPGGFAENNIESIERNAEWCLHRLSTHWEVKLSNPVDVYITNSLRRLTGIAAPHAISNKIFIDNYRVTTTTFYHELVHAIHQDCLNPKLSVWLNRCIIEGLAMAYDHDLVFLPEAHKEFAGALKAGRLPSAVDLMNPLSFWKINEYLAYKASGSFIGFLIYKYGIDKFKDFQKSLDYKKVYGYTLSDLDKKWNHFLEAIPLSFKDRISGGDAFDITLFNSYSMDCCPKLGRTHPLKKEKALSLLYGRQYKKAFKIYMELFETTGGVNWGFQAAICLLRQQKFSKALLIFDKLLDQCEPGSFEIIKILKAKVIIFSTEQDWSSLYQTFEKLNSFKKGSLEKNQQIIELLLRDPKLRSIVANALTTKDNYKRRYILEELSKTYPKDQSIQYLYATKAVPPIPLRSRIPITPEEESRIRWLIKILKKHPDSLVYRAKELLGYIRVSVFFFNYELAEQICKLLIENTNDPLIHFKAKVWLDRINFVSPSIFN